MYDRYAEALLRLDPGVRLAVENHRLSPAGLIDWAEGNPGLALDIEHLWKFTLLDAPLGRLLDEVRAFLAHFGGKLRHVHLPGYWPGSRRAPADVLRPARWCCRCCRSWRRRASTAWW